MRSAILLWLLLCGAASAQEQSIVSIRVDIGGGAIASGTGAIVKVTDEVCPDQKFAGWRRASILTANHVIEGAQSIGLYLRGGENTVGRTSTKGRDGASGDVAIVDAFVPPNYSAIEMGQLPFIGSPVVAYGLGADAIHWPERGSLRVLPGSLKGAIVEYSSVGVPSNRTLAYDICVRQGDSGGPILCDGKVVGVISGGMTEFVNACTWPLLSAHTDVVRGVIR